MELDERNSSKRNNMANFHICRSLSCVFAVSCALACPAIAAREQNSPDSKTTSGTKHTGTTSGAKPPVHYETTSGAEVKTVSSAKPETRSAVHTGTATKAEPNTASRASTKTNSESFRSPDAVRLLEKARQLRKNFDDEESIACYTDYLKKYPDDDQARYEVADIYADNRNYEKAYELYKRVSYSHVKSLSADGCRSAGKICLKMRRYKEAAELFERGIKSGDSGMYVDLSDALRSSGHPEKALEICNIIEKTNSVAARHHRARAYAALKQPDKALPLYDSLIAFQKDRIRASVNQTRAVFKMTKWLIELLNERARCYQSINKTAAAQRDLDEIHAIDKEAYDESPFLTHDK